MERFDQIFARRRKAAPKAVRRPLRKIYRKLVILSFSKPVKAKCLPQPTWVHCAGENLSRVISADGRPEMAKFVKLLKNEKGATAIEYGLIAALIAVAAIGAMTSVGTKLSATFTNVSGSL